MRAIPFVKMHGLGNDFVVVADALLPEGMAITPELARAIGHRNFGVGFDQLLWLRAPRGPGADLRMEIFNTDGSIAEMCGNGIRAVALYARDRAEKLGLARKDRYAIETLAGLKTVEIVRGADGGDRVVVDMGVPVLGGGFPSEGEAIEAEGRTFKFFEVSMGNPHAVIFVEGNDADLYQKVVTNFGQQIEKHPRFPKRTNVEFVQIRDEHKIQVDVWERGAGITLACGTGACAAAVAALRTKRVKNDVTVQLPGGMLKISWDGEGKPVFMEGPAVEVFSGQYSIAD